MTTATHLGTAFPLDGGPFCVGKKDEVVVVAILEVEVEVEVVVVVEVEVGERRLESNGWRVTVGE